MVIEINSNLVLGKPEQPDVLQCPFEGRHQLQTNQKVYIK